MQVDPTSSDFQVARVKEASLSDISFYSRIEGGSGGVFILCSASSGVLVAKSGGQVFQEAYALQLGIFASRLVINTDRKDLKFLFTD